MKTIINAVQNWTKKEIKDNIKNSTADWNQNDASAVDYVKNRTHWSDGVVEEVVLERQTVTNSDIVDCELIVGQAYEVTWDNKVYHCVAWGNSSVIGLGFGQFVDVGEGETVPFLIYNNKIRCEHSTTHTISITTTVENIHKLDSKYLDLPTNLATTDDVQEALDVANEAQSTAYTAMTNAATAQAVADDNAEKLLEVIDVDKISLHYGTGHGIAYGNGKFVSIAGNSGLGVKTNAVAYSIDGIVWEKGIMPITNYWNGPYYANGKFFANVATKGRNLYYSEDGIVWKHTTFPSNADWCSVVYGNNKYVATASNSNAGAYSIDGIIWEKGIMPSNHQWASVAYGNGKFVAVAVDTNVVVCSEDGITWNQTATLPTLHWNYIAYSNGKFVVIGENDDLTKHIISYSEDGITWAQIDFPTSDNPSQMGVLKIYAFDGGKFIICDSTVKSPVIYSEDGIVWTESITRPSHAISSIAYGNGKYVASCHGNAAYYSEDCVTWSNSCHEIRQNNEDVTDKVKNIILPISTTAQVGQLLSVKAVDENGKPAEWEAVDPLTIFEEFGFTVDENGTLVGGVVGGGTPTTANTVVMTDEVTGVQYKLSVADGKLKMTEVTSE